MPDQLIGESQRQIGGSANIDGDNAELFRTVQFDRITEQAKAGIVDDELDLHPFGGQGRGNLVAGIGLFEIAGNHHRRRSAACLDFTRQRRKPFRPSRHQSDAMTVRCENPRQFGPYSGRGPRNQRYALSHDPMLLNKLHNVQPSRGTRAYALDGTQVTCKPIGALKRTVLRNRTAITAAKCARRGRRPHTLRIRHVRRRVARGSIKPPRYANRP